MIRKYYTGSIIFTLICFGLAVWLGFSMHNGDWLGMLSVLWIVFVLSILEVSLSFDNAVVNATVLRDMDEKWRRRFLTWGIAIAVFGMRIVFPIAIVAVAAQLTPWDAVTLAATRPDLYEQYIGDAHVGIAGFGGAFLAMVGLKFFFDSDKEVHWIAAIEKYLSKLSSVPAVEIAVLLGAMWAISSTLPLEDANTFLVAGIAGLLTFIGVEAIGELLEGEEDVITGQVVRSGAASFLYLEVLDASFSFDGVIGAFALSNNIFIIAIGLGVGAMFVRSMTIMLVDKGTLAEYRYLEHGAFWAIIALAIIMLTSANEAWHFPETITGLIGAVFIGMSFWWSVRHNRKHPHVEADPVKPSGAHGAETATLGPNDSRPV